jgi:hypothetical protein
MKNSFTGDFIRKQKDRAIAKDIINLYNTKIAKKILKGEQYDFLGKIYLTKVINKSDKLSCLSGATKRARLETGDNSIIIYRTNDYWFKLVWSGRWSYTHIDVKFVKENKLSIPLYEQDLLIHAPIYNK